MNTETQYPIFSQAVDHVLRMEGGYVNDPKDPGGETKYGISKRAHPDVDIANLRRAEAITIYHRDYWLKPNLHELPPRIAFIMFDTVVNQGKYWSITQLQTLVGVEPDGLIGPKTLEAIKTCNEHALITRILVNRSRHYMRISQRQPKFKRFLVGWLARVFEVHKTLLTEFRP